MAFCQFCVSVELHNLPFLVVGQFLFLRCRPLERDVPIKRLADSQFAAIFPILANRVGELRNLSMSARDYKRIAPFGSELAMQLRHYLASVEDGYLAKGTELFQLCEPFLR